MTPSWRKPFGILVMLSLVTAWLVGTVTLVEHVPLLDNMLTYIVSGIVWIWVLPMRRLLCWMETGRFGAPRER